MSKLAVIGIDAEIGDHSNIDRVERAFYLGQPLAQSMLAANTDLAQLCLNAVSRMAKTNAVQIQDVHVVLLADAANNTIVNTLNESAASCACMSNLSEALEASWQLTEKAYTVALIGCYQSSQPPLSDENVKANISFDEGFESYIRCEGFAALLLTQAARAQDNKQFVYANIAAFASDDDIACAAEAALRKACVVAEQVTLLEVSALADAALNEKEQSSLLDAYRFDKPLHTAISCARSVMGDAPALSQVLGLLKCVLNLHQRYIPGIIDWQQPQDAMASRWQSSPFYFPVDARAWFPHSPNSELTGKAHAAAYSCLSTDSYCHVILQEELLEKGCDTRLNGFIASSDLHLFILSGDDESALQQQLTQLQKKLNTDNLSDLAKQSYAHFLQASNAIYRVSLLAESSSDLIKEIQLAQAGINKAFIDIDANISCEWKTPKGSYFSAEPVGNEGIAFMYPGIGATYVGLGRDLFHLFPEIYQPVAALADDIGSSLKDTILNPRSVHRLGFKELKKIDSDLRNSLAHIAECGVGYACVFTKIFEEVFKINADFSTGYSMGEISMYAALGCWEEPGLMSARLANSDTFNHHLSGELRTLRSHWNLPAIEDGEKEKIWETYTIKATAEEVAAASVDEDRVYCTIINTPDSLLIGGYPAACERVIKKLGVRAMALNMPNAIHSAPAFKEYEDMEALYTMDVTERIDTKMYSSSCYLPIPQRTKAIANSIAKCLCDPVDFPRLVNTLHDKGSRVFIEMGPGRSLCSWVDKILKHEEIEGSHKAHVSLPVNAKGTDDELTFVRAIAKLVSHGVTVDLHNLYHGTIVVNNADKHHALSAVK